MASRLLQLSGSLRTIPKRFNSSNAADFKNALASSPAADIDLLNNGVRIAVQNTGSPTATVGLWIDAGSRYEEPTKAGVANFLQNVIFKGTNKRSRTDLESEVANLGARLHAYTTPEQTAYYATCLSKDVPKLVEILSESLQNPKLDESEIENARQNLLAELDAAENDLKQVALNLLHFTAYEGTSLALPVTGTPDNVKSITRSDLQNYIDNHYKACRVVLACSGGVDQSALVSAAEKGLSGLDNTFDGVVPLLPTARYTGSILNARDDNLPNAYIALAVQGPGWNSPDNLVLSVAAEIIGSWERSQGNGDYQSSKLTRICSEECELFQAFNIAYNDTGLFGVYAASGPMVVGDMVESIQYEWRRLSTTVTEGDVTRGKNALKFKLLKQISNTTGACSSIGSDLLRDGKHTTALELINRIDAISADKVVDVCNNYVYDRCPVVGCAGATEAVPDILNLRSGMSGLVW